MNRDEEWNEFFNGLLSRALRNLQGTKEHEYRIKWREHMDELLTNNLTSDQKELVEEIFVEFRSDAEHEAALIYRQGWKDGVWLFKNLELSA